MTHLLSLAAGTVLDTDAPGTILAAAAAGFDASGVWVEVDHWNDAITAAVRRRLDDTGLIALDAEVIRIKPDGDLSTGLRLIDIAAAIGARFVLCISEDPDLSRTAERFAMLCEHGAAVGVRPVIEFMRFTTVRTLPDALAVVARAGHPAAGVLVDALHLARSGHRPAELAGIDPGLLPYAQLCDAPALAPPESELRREALDGRCLPGEGGLPLGELLDVLPASAPLSVELRSAQLREQFPDPVQRACAVAAATRLIV
jgi:sugar phosphate isomerase/epimerase